MYWIMDGGYVTIVVGFCWRLRGRKTHLVWGHGLTSNSVNKFKMVSWLVQCHMLVCTYSTIETDGTFFYPLPVPFFSPTWHALLLKSSALSFDYCLSRKVGSSVHESSPIECLIFAHHFSKLEKLLHYRPYQQEIQWSCHENLRYICYVWDNIHYRNFEMISCVKVLVPNKNKNISTSNQNGKLLNLTMIFVRRKAPNVSPAEIFEIKKYVWDNIH